MEGTNSQAESRASVSGFKHVTISQAPAVLQGLGWAGSHFRAVVAPPGFLPAAPETPLHSFGAWSAHLHGQGSGSILSDVPGCGKVIAQAIREFCGASAG